ncbi:MAG: rod-binding protein [Rickettsiales bacterium]|nr:rod-binding protein [Rickettsiales bacterium]
MINSDYINSIIDFSKDNLRFQNLQNEGLKIKSLTENKSDNLKEIEKTAKDFESMFIGQLLGFMYNTIEVDPLFGGGFGESAYRDLMIEEYGKIISESGGVGIADSIQKKLIEMQMQ